MKRLQIAALLAVLALLIYGGGKPNPGTKKDMRLTRNNPNAGKTAQSKVTKAAMPVVKKGK